MKVYLSDFAALKLQKLSENILENWDANTNDKFFLRSSLKK
jgi:hypothetical protein